MRLRGFQDCPSLSSAGRPNGKKALSQNDIEAIRAMRLTMSGAKLAALFGVNRKTIQRYATKKKLQSEMS